MYKKIFYFSMLLFAALMVTGCGKDEGGNNGENNVGDIVGVWEYYDLKVVDLKSKNQTFTSAQIKEIENKIKKGGSPFGNIFELTPDGELYIDGEYGYKYSVKGNKIAIAYESEYFRPENSYDPTVATAGDEVLNVTYSISGNKLQANLDMLEYDPDLEILNYYPDLKEKGITKFVVSITFIRQK